MVFYVAKTWQQPARFIHQRSWQMQEGGRGCGNELVNLRSTIADSSRIGVSKIGQKRGVLQSPVSALVDFCITTLLDHGACGESGLKSFTIPNPPTRRKPTHVVPARGLRLAWVKGRGSSAQQEESAFYHPRSEQVGIQDLGSLAGTYGLLHRYPTRVPHLILMASNATQ